MNRDGGDAGPRHGQLPTECGTYLMVMRAATDIDVKVGRLARNTLKPGWYCYVGSAFGPGGLAARCSRHARRDKVCRWHLDYLAPHLQFAEVWYALGPNRFEHQWAAAMEDSMGFSPAWPRFGASDCRCTTHLWCRRKRPSLSGFRQLVSNPAVKAIVLED